MSTRARIEDVALAAGVSTATVSRALSNPTQVGAARRGRVLKAVKSLGYAPDQAARALASGKTQTVGCVVPSIDHAIFAKSTQALQHALGASGYQLILASHEYDLTKEHAAVITMQQRGVDALVLVGSDHLAKTWKAIRAWSKPTMLTWSCDKRLPSVGFNNHGVGYRLAEHLLALGHRKIAVISAHTATNDRARSRVQGVRDALATAGLELPEHYVEEQPYSLAGGRVGLVALCQNKQPPTAIVGGNDLLAAGALLEAQRRGIAVPDQISICGAGDHEWARELNPGLTTVRLPTAELGRLAAEQLTEALDGRAFEAQRFVDFDLMERGSSGRAPSSMQMVKRFGR